MNPMNKLEINKNKICNIYKIKNKRYIKNKLLMIMKNFFRIILLFHLK